MKSKHSLSLNVFRYFLVFVISCIVYGVIPMLSSAETAETLEVNLLQGKTIGGFGTAIGKFQYPQGIGVGINNEIHIVDNTNKRVQVFDKENLQYKRKYGEGIFYPIDVAIDSMGNSYVSEYGSDIYVYDSQGIFLRKFSTAQSGDRPWPEGLFVDPVTGYIVVAGAPTENGRISVWNSQGQMIKFWSVKGAYDVWISKAGAIYVDAWDKIFQYDINGNLIKQFPAGYGAVGISGSSTEYLFITYYYDGSTTFKRGRLNVA